MKMRFGRYEVVCKLGEGAMAAVYLARDPVLARFVAIKVLHSKVAAGATALQRFFNEAKTVAKVRNPHVVEVFDFGREGRDYFLVMEFVDGQSLHGLLGPTRPAGKTTLDGGMPAQPAPSGQPLGDTLTAALLCQAAEGLDIAGRHGVVHRDIKPENLLINSHGYLKIADFGIAHLQDESLTRTGAVLGSPLYMSPEQVRGAKPITSQSDMFSLGALLYRCLSGSPPFASANLKDLYRKIAREPHLPLQVARPDLDPALADLAETLLQKDPDRRGGGPRWLRARLRAYLMAQGIDDPMEQVGLHLRDLAQRGVPTTWKLDSPGSAPPRTIAGSSPDLDGPAHGLSRLATVRGPVPSSGPPPAGFQGWEAASRKGGGMGAKVLVAAGVLALGGTGLYWVQAKMDGRVLDKAPRMAEAAYSQPVLDLSTEAGGKAAGSPGPEDPSPVPKAPEATAVHRESSRTEPGPEPESESEDPPGLETATLLVQSSPPFAEVFLDGNSMGVTPVKLRNLVVGRHRLLVKGRSGPAFDTLLHLRAGNCLVKIRLDGGAVAFESED